MPPIFPESAPKKMDDTSISLTPRRAGTLRSQGTHDKKASPSVTGWLFEIAECVGLRKQVDRAGLLDRVVDLAMKFRRDTGDAARKDLAGLRRELGEKLRIGRDDEIRWDVMPATWHHAVRLAEIDTALDCFWL